MVIVEFYLYFSAKHFFKKIARIISFTSIHDTLIIINQKSHTIRQIILTKLIYKIVFIK